MSQSDEKAVRVLGRSALWRDRGYVQAEGSARAGGGSRAMPSRDFAVTLLDGRRVIGRHHDRGEGWSIYVYPPDGNGSILGYASASTRTDALREAGLSGEDAGETLGRAGI